MKKTLGIGAVYVAAVVGAGFASGQEILTFFSIHGVRGIVGIFISGLLFGVCGAFVLSRAYREDITSFDVYLSAISGKTIGALCNVITFLFMIAGFCVMAAGSGALVAQQAHIDRGWGVLAMLLICALVFVFDIRGIMMLSGVLAPLMILGILFLSARALAFRDVAAFAPSAEMKGGYILSGFLYASYNLICAIAILATMGREVKSIRSAIWAATISTVALTGMAAVMWGVICLYHGRVTLGEVPMYTLAVRQGALAAQVYGAVLYMAMLTTAVANGYCVIGAVCSKTGMARWQAIGLLCAFAYPIALFRFSDMVKNLYTLFGFAGFLLVILVIKDGVKMMAESFSIKGRCKKSL